MSEETGLLEVGTSPEQPLEPLSWHQTWLLALTQPSVATFERIARDPNASSRRAYKWVLISSLVSDALLILVYAVIQPPFTFNALSGFASELICAIPLTAFVLVFTIIIFSFIAQWISKKMGGTGTYSQLIYAFAASLAPITLVVALVNIIPLTFVQYLTTLLGIYGIFLDVLAVRAVHQFGWGKAIGSYLLTQLSCLFMLILVIGVPVALVIGAVILTNNQTIWQADPQTDPYAKYYEDLSTLIYAFEQKWGTEDSILNGNINFDTGDDDTGVWMVGEISFIGECNETPSDPCNQLADEFARLVFSDFNKVNDLAGIQVILTSTTKYLYVEFYSSTFEKSLTIAEWREELSIEK